MSVTTVDKEFNELMNRDIKEKISYAFISLSANFNKLAPGLKRKRTENSRR